jgi:hypothetical protein
VDVLHESDTDTDVGQVLSDNEHNYNEENSNSIEQIMVQKGTNSLAYKTKTA